MRFMLCPCCNQALPDIRIIVDPNAGTVLVDGTVHQLTVMEMRVFAPLYEASPKYISLDNLVMRTYAGAREPASSGLGCVTVFLYHLRRRFAQTRISVSRSYGRGARITVGPPPD